MIAITFASYASYGRVVGNTGVSMESYIVGSSDMPSLLEQLKFRDDNNNWKYFSSGAFNNYKCYSPDTSSSNDYVLDMLKRYTSSNSSFVDKVGIGPRTYYIDDCTNDQTEWRPFGET